MAEQNGNGYAKKLHLYATAIATIVAMMISVFSYMREMKDERAREQAGEGLNAQQETIAALRASVEFNRQLLLQLYQSTDRRSQPRDEAPRSPGGGSAPRSQPSPDEDGNANRPPVPRLIPPDELFQRAPKIPKQEKRNWKDYEQRLR